MAAGATVFRDTLTSVIPAGVRVTSPTLRCSRRRSHPRQPCIRDSNGSFPNGAHSLFFSSKCRLFHNATFFGSCIIHILHAGCAKI